MPSHSLQKIGVNTVAFAFDIDGVLVNGKTPIAGARETLLKLQKENIPFIFLTNSGGVTEQENLNKLSLRLGEISFDERQIVQSHTPFRALVKEYGNKTILVLGGHGDNIRQVAKAYGFHNVVTSSDLVVQNENTHPFPEMTKAHHFQHGQKQPRDNPLQIAAILVWSSPRDWCLDLQVTLDLLLSSKGIVNTRSELNGKTTLPNNGFLQDEQPRLFFCNPDFEWATKHDHPRLAQGGFREALRAELHYTICGKPTHTTYQYGEHALQNLIAADPKIDGGDINTVYMIGDNPESDIAGANTYQSQYGYCWRSVLVETGVYRSGTVPAHRPNRIVPDVAAAIDWALNQ